MVVKTSIKANSRALVLSGFVVLREEGINKRFRDSLRDSLPESNRCRCYMTFFLIFWLTNSGPNSAHQLIMAFRAIIEATVGFSKRIRFLSSSDEETFGGESRYDASFLATSWKITHRWSAHGNRIRSRVFNGRIHPSLEKRF